MVVLLLTLLILFFTAPFVQALPDGSIVDAALFSTVLAAALLAVAGLRGAITLGVVLAVPALAGRWVVHFQNEDYLHVFANAAFLIFVSFVIFNLLRFILRAPQVDLEVLCAGIAIYLLLAVLWASAYALVARLSPDSFGGVPAERQPLHGFDALYFSAGALTTGGFGDITPLSGVARMLGMLEAITGTMFLAVLVARLVSLYSSPAAPNSPTD